MKLILKIIWLLLSVALGVGLVQITRNASKLQFSCKHGLEDNQCAFCDPSLVEKLGYCKGHEVAEAFCTRCSPYLIPAFQQEGDWCAEHNLPDSQCKQCSLDKNPKLSTSAPAVDDNSQSDNVAHLRSMQAPNDECDNDGLMIEFKDEKVAQTVKLDFIKIKPSDEKEYILCNVEISFDENKFAQIIPRSPGILASVDKKIGEKVSEGELLAKIHSSALAKAKSDYLKATALFQLWERNHKAEVDLQKSGATSRRSVLESETKMIENRIAQEQALHELLYLGLSTTEIQALAQKPDGHSILKVSAPFEGVIVERNAVQGELVDQKHPLFKIADTNSMWARLSILPSNVNQVSVGDRVTVMIPELEPKIYTSQISWIASSIDEHTRSLEALAVLENKDGRLKSGMFGQAKVLFENDLITYMVPREAVQWDGCCNVVFVKKSNSSFETRKVQLMTSARLPDYYLLQNSAGIIWEVVTTGSYLLKTELMKGDIGAGCCEVEPGR